MLTVGVIGAGSMGLRHVDTLLQHGCRVVLCDSDGKALHARPATIPVLIDGSLTSIPWHSLDAVVIATPYDRHLEYVSECVGRRMPFYLEKPLGPIAEYDQWRRLSRQVLPVHQIGYQLRFHPVIVRAAIERPRTGSLVVHSDMRRWPGWYYGPMLLEFSHEIDLALYLGAPQQVMACSQDGDRIWIRLGDPPDEWLLSFDSSEGAQYFRLWNLAGVEHVFTTPADLNVEPLYRIALAAWLGNIVAREACKGASLLDAARVLRICRDVMETLER